MRNRNTQGFTLIELLIVIAIIGILAAVLIPNLLNARARAFDSGAQTCLRELGTQAEVAASNAPFQYDQLTVDLTVDPLTVDVAGGGAEAVQSCENVSVTAVVEADDFGFAAHHNNGTTPYGITNGSGVEPYAQVTFQTTADPADPTP